MSLLERINNPEDLKVLSIEELSQLSGEIRRYILDVISSNGGHLGAALGAVELAVALHYTFQSPQDAMIWDVGHQAHAHKILTGRRDAFKSLRQHGGLSGFLNKDESEHDLFTTGHAGASISTALGLAVGRRLEGKEKGHVIAVIGDASLANGMAFEALNHAGHLKENLIVVLNDNEMSISPTVGAISNYLNKIISAPFYDHLRQDFATILKKIPRVGDRLASKAKKIDEGLKNLFIPGLLFEELGFKYFGPLDGHNLGSLVKVLKNISKIEGPVFLHVLTKKGKGYSIAEEDPAKWHASTPFCVETGEPVSAGSGRTYTQVFGDSILKLAEADPRVVAITAAMCDGTGLQQFSKKFPDRFFDVGIAEEHAVSFAAGLARGGFKPFVAIYSSFLQRSYDQMIHDVALQNLPVVFCVDRAGLVGEDGPTHHGVLDISYFNAIPGMTVMAPCDGRELSLMMEYASRNFDGPVALRFPRGGVPDDREHGLDKIPPVPFLKGKSEILRQGKDVLILACGSMVVPAYEAAALLEKESVQATVVNARFIKPLDAQAILRLADGKLLVVTVEEGVLSGGFGSAVLEVFASRADAKRPAPPVKILGLPDCFVEHGKRDFLLEKFGLTPEGIKNSIVGFLHGLTKAGGKAKVSAAVVGTVLRKVRI
jgi:1-deoxy-D-xylulose-5-phosphate synthase